MSQVKARHFKLYSPSVNTIRRLQVLSSGPVPIGDPQQLHLYPIIRYSDLPWWFPPPLVDLFSVPDSGLGSQEVPILQYLFSSLVLSSTLRVTQPFLWYLGTSTSLLYTDQLLGLPLLPLLLSRHESFSKIYYPYYRYSKWIGSYTKSYFRSHDYWYSYYHIHRTGSHTMCHPRVISTILTLFRGPDPGPCVIQE